MYLVSKFGGSQSRDIVRGGPVIKNHPVSIWAIHTSIAATKSSLTSTSSQNGLNVIIAWVYGALTSTSTT